MNAELIERLRLHQRDCVRVADIDSDAVLSRHQVDDLADAIAEAIAALEAQGRDAERLDYIERTFAGVTSQERYLPVRMIWGKGCNGRTLREACDKYMTRDAAIGSGEAGNA